MDNKESEEKLAYRKGSEKKWVKKLQEATREKTQETEPNLAHLTPLNQK